MSETDRSRSRSEELLSSALRDLARSSPQSASEATRAALAREFHRRHLRRKTARMTAIVAIALIAFGGSIGVRILLRNRPSAEQVEGPSSISRSQPSAMVQPISGPSELSQSANAHQGALHPAGNREEALFLALPSFALATPGEDLRLIRVEMPLSSLRLLGARVNDEFLTKLVVADLLIGPDGTPYAFRLVT